MDPTDLARIQFASTTIYHFLFVPVTIGLRFWWRSCTPCGSGPANPSTSGLTKFFGTLLLINVAVGVVTGLVQEFQFGMNWSAYSRFVGDVFGAPLAMEGLAAFFLESTFLGLWIFAGTSSPVECTWPRSGWSRLAQCCRPRSSWPPTLDAEPGGIHHRRGNRTAGTQLDRGRDDEPGLHLGVHPRRPRVALTGAVVMLAVSAWHLRRRSDSHLFRRTAALSIVVLLPTSILILLVGSHLGVIEATYQPMKIAAAEAQWDTCQPCSFSAFQIGGGNDDPTPTKIIQIPHLLSVLATGTWNGEVQGMNELQAQYEQEYGPGYYIPNVFIQYWSMRVMAYLGALMSLLALWGAWLLWRRKLETSRVFLWVATWAVIAPFLMNTAGWMLTENGRQPWLVQGLMKTEDGVSPSVSTTDLVISLAAYYAIFIALAGVYAFLMFRYARRGWSWSTRSRRQTTRVRQR